MFCINCGKELPNNAIFCTRCGKTVKPLKQSAPEKEQTITKVKETPEKAEIASQPQLKAEPQPTSRPPNVEEKKQEPASFEPVPLGAEKPLSSFVESMDKDLRQRLFFEGDACILKDEQGKEQFKCNPGLEGLASGLLLCKWSNKPLFEQNINSGWIFQYVKKRIEMLPEENIIRKKMEQYVMDSNNTNQQKYDWFVKIMGKLRAGLEKRIFSQDETIAMIREAMESEFLDELEKSWVRESLGNQFIIDCLIGLIDKKVIKFLNLKADMSNTEKRILDANCIDGLMTFYFALRYGVKSYGVGLNIDKAKKIRRHFISNGYFNEDDVVLKEKIDADYIANENIDIVYNNYSLIIGMIAWWMLALAPVGTQFVSMYGPLGSIPMICFDVREAGTVPEDVGGRKYRTLIYTKKKLMSEDEARFFHMHLDLIGRLYRENGELAVKVVPRKDINDTSVVFLDGETMKPLYEKGKQTPASAKLYRNTEIDISLLKKDFLKSMETYLSREWAGGFNDLMKKFWEGVIKIYIMEDNASVRAAVDVEGNVYVCKSLTDDPVMFYMAIFHELGERYFGMHVEELESIVGRGVIAHAALRGAGKDIREYIKKHNLEKESAEELMGFLEKMAARDGEIRGLTDSEKALMGSNEEKGIPLFYGIQDGIFGKLNEEFSRKLTDMKMQLKSKHEEEKVCMEIV